MGERDAIGRVYIERLRLGARGGAGGGIAHVADADVAVEVGDGTLGEHVRHHPVVLVQAKVTIRRRRHNASSVLPPVLQRQQRLKEGTGGRAGSCIASYAAHSWRGSVYGDLAALTLPGLLVTGYPFTLLHVGHRLSYYLLLLDGGLENEYVRVERVKLGELGRWHGAVTSLTSEKRAFTITPTQTKAMSCNRRGRVTTLATRRILESRYSHFGCI